MGEHLDEVVGGKIDDDGVSHPVYHYGSQWAVTAYGIECIDRHDDGRRHVYYIAKGELGRRNDNDTPAWPYHMSSKTWVDVEDFCSVFVRSLEIHHVNPDAFAENWPQLLKELAPKVKRRRIVSSLIRERIRENTNFADGFVMSEYSKAEKQLLAEGVIDAEDVGFN